MQFYTYNGVFSEEKKLGQKISVDVVLDFDIENQVKNDDLQTTISYAEVYEQIKDYVENHKFNLIESVANNLLEILLEKNARADRITINIRKGSVPIEGIFDDVQITVSGTNNSD
jgi:dihydroneopterin aldolase